MNLQKRRQVKNIALTAIICFLLSMSFLILIRPIGMNIRSRNVYITINAPGKKNTLSDGTSVYIRGITANDRDILSLKDYKVSGGWTYWADTGMFCAEDPITPMRMSLPIEDVYSLKMKLVYSRKSGIVEIQVGSQKQSFDLYRDTEWEEEYVDIWKDPLIYPEESQAVIGLLLLFSVLLAVLLSILSGKNGLIQRESVRRWELGTVLTFLLSVFLAFGCEWIIRGSLTSALQWCIISRHLFFQEVLLLWLIIGIFECIFGRIPIAVFFPILVVIFYAAASSIKLQFRGTPVFFWDILSVKTLGSVIRDYPIRIPVSAIIVIILFILAQSGMILVSKKQKIRMSSRLAGGSILLVLLILYISTSYIHREASMNLYQINQGCEEEGYVNSFFYFIKYHSQKVDFENYSENVLENLGIKQEKIESEFERTKENDYIQDLESPNILIVLGESFWDAARLKEICGDEDPLFWYHQIQNESIFGEALVNVFGGGTVNSEWEVITGLNSLFLPQDYMPYLLAQQDKNDFSVFNLLESQGYQSFAVHPYQGSNYSREETYANLGIDLFLTEDDFSIDAKRIRGYISDEEVYRKAFETGSQMDTPWVGLVVTMQNHGGYGYETDLIDELKEQYPLNLNVDAYDEIVKPGIYDMICGIKAKDSALSTLIEEGSACEKPTIIIYFGDHMADSYKGGQSFLDTCGLYDAEDDVMMNYEKHRVPFFIWNNQNSYSENIGTISLAQLLPVTFERYSLKMPMFWEYVRIIGNYLPACGSDIYINFSGETKKLTAMTEEETKYLDGWRYLQYDYLYGERYYKDWFTVEAE